MNTICLISVTNFNSDKQDKHGKSPVWLNPIAGKMPNRFVLSGTMAERVGLTVGTSAMVQFVERDANEYGRQFNIVPIAVKLSPIDIMDGIIKFGDAVVVNVNASEQTNSSAPDSAQALAASMEELEVTE